MVFDIKKLNTVTTVTNKTSSKREAFEELLRKNDFKAKQESNYKLWRLSGSVSTLYVRTYDTKIQCLLFGDFEPYVYLTLKYEDINKRLEGENLFLILLKDDKK